MLVDRIGDALRALEEKLMRVTNTVAPSAGAKAESTTPAPYRVPLAQKICNSNNSLEKLLHGLEDLLPRIEL